MSKLILMAVVSVMVFTGISVAGEPTESGKMQPQGQTTDKKFVRPTGLITPQGVIKKFTKNGVIDSEGLAKYLSGSNLNSSFAISVLRELSNIVSANAETGETTNAAQEVIKKMDPAALLKLANIIQPPNSKAPAKADPLYTMIMNTLYPKK